jgi:hypothetical protein
VPTAKGIFFFCRRGWGERSRSEWRASVREFKENRRMHYKELESGNVEINCHKENRTTA